MLFLSCVCPAFASAYIAALWSPAGKGLTSWLLFVMFNCVFVTFPCGILGQVWYLIVSIPDLCRLSYFVLFEKTDILVHKLFEYRILFIKIPFRNGILETDDDNSCHVKPGPKVIKLSSCSTQLSLKFQLLKESNLYFCSCLNTQMLYLSC